MSRSELHPARPAGGALRGAALHGAAPARGAGAPPHLQRGGPTPAAVRPQTAEEGQRSKEQSLWPAPFSQQPMEEEIRWAGKRMGKAFQVIFWVVRNVFCFPMQTKSCQCLFSSGTWQPVHPASLGPTTNIRKSGPFLLVSLHPSAPATKPLSPPAEHAPGETTSYTFKMADYQLTAKNKHILMSGNYNPFLHRINARTLEW